MTGQHAYFEKDGKIEKAPLAKWARYRRSGWVFSTLAAYNAQEHGTPVAEEDDGLVTLPTMADNKDTITAFADENEIEYDPNQTKAEILAVIEAAY